MRRIRWQAIASWGGREIDRVEEQHDQVDVIERAALERRRPLVQLSTDLDTLDRDVVPSPASSHRDSMSRIDRPRTNPPMISALSGSVRNSRLQCHFGNSFETNGITPREPAESRSATHPPRSAHAGGETRCAAPSHSCASRAAAGLVESKREGRYKFHHLNPRPLERIADRWLQADPKEAR
jgi:hypothetical protein